MEFCKIEEEKTQQGSRYKERLEGQLMIDKEFIRRLESVALEDQFHTMKSSVKSLLMDVKLQSDVKKEHSTNLDFEVSFEKRLIQAHPDLSQSEIMLCKYIEQGCSTKEICVIQNKQSNTINAAKYRIRKKMAIEGDLYGYLRSI